jgi:mannose-6-phosphate isomerase-like protein (cupin superfamily)
VSTIAEVRPHVVTADAEPLWFLGTLARIKLGGEQTGGRFALWEGVMPHGAAPPLHSHPQDETVVLLEGRMTVWLVEPELAGEAGDMPGWVGTCAQDCPVGGVLFAPGGFPHTFRIESDTARLLFLSTPAGIEEMIRALAEPARWPWLQPPPDGPRVPAELAARVERATGMVRHGPPPPPAR